MSHPVRFPLKPLAAAIGALSMPVAHVYAQEAVRADNAIEEIVVLAARRATSVQDVPFNVAAVDSQQIEEQGMKNLGDIAAWVPGLHIVDQGGRGASRIVVRGLNADPARAQEQLNNTGGSVVATYVGEIPLYVDLKLNDIDRVEVLLGPQGTLYGAGTLGGAIRYFPAKPEYETTTIEVRGDAFGYSQSEDAGYDLGGTLNIPIGQNFALRANVDYLDDPGFIDYRHVVREIGVSDPDPDLTDPDAVRANTREIEDANDEQTLSGRIAARWSPTEAIDALLTYYYQNQDVGARQISHHDGFGTSKYATAMRLLEPNERENRLTALEITADLGFAELTSATGFSQYEDDGRRDQTDLLITLEVSYEAFPSFTGLAIDQSEEDTFTQELRLLSTHEGPFEWILGAFYNDYDLESLATEYTPGFDIFAVDNFGGFGPRPDSLEYYASTDQDLTEMAVYGELKWNLTDDWQMTVGARWYDYDFEEVAGTALPLCDTVFGGAPPDSIDFFGPCGSGLTESGQEEDGTLFKFNTSYYFTDDVMAYVTYSEGYRIGSSNGVPLCPDPLPPNQSVCGGPDELEYVPDETQNYEVGMRSSWFENTLVVNGALFFIDWSDPQVDGATQVGLQPITRNGSGAESIGGEVGFNWAISEHWGLRGSYSYTQAELSDRAPGLVTTIEPPGFASVYIDGEDGDRLPGSPEHQGSLFLDFSLPLDNGLVFDFNYGVWAISDVLTRTGSRGNGDELPGYAVHNAAWSISGENWTTTLYADNLFDKWAKTSARDTVQFQQELADFDGGPVVVRRYYHDVLTPRVIGLRFTYTFESF